MADLLFDFLDILSEQCLNYLKYFLILILIVLAQSSEVEALVLPAPRSSSSFLFLLLLLSVVAYNRREVVLLDEVACV